LDSLKDLFKPEDQKYCVLSGGGIALGGLSSASCNLSDRLVVGDKFRSLHIDRREGMREIMFGCFILFLFLYPRVL